MKLVWFSNTTAEKILVLKKGHIGIIKKRKKAN